MTEGYELIVELRLDLRKIKEDLDKALVRIADLEKENLQLKKENDEVKKRLTTYENANTPPSKQRFKEPEETKDDEKGEKKRGRPPGAEGSTRETPTPTVNNGLIFPIFTDTSHPKL